MVERLFRSQSFLWLGEMDEHGFEDVPVVEEPIIEEVEEVITIYAEYICVTPGCFRERQYPPGCALACCCKEGRLTVCRSHDDACHRRTWRRMLGLAPPLPSR